MGTDLPRLPARDAHSHKGDFGRVLVVAQARRPDFYAARHVPDSVDGRFDMLALHLFLMLDRLRDEPAARRLAQELADAFVRDMDVNLREMGVGDLSVGKKVRGHAAALYGRLAVYRTAFAQPDDAALTDAIQRNIYRSDAPASPDARALAAYARRQAAALWGVCNGHRLLRRAPGDPS